jgi:hypothetical protein
MEFNLVVLDHDQVSSFGTPLHTLIAGDWWDHRLVYASHGCVMPLEVHLLANLEHELLTLSVKERISQINEGVSRSSFFNCVACLHDLLKVTDLACAQ